MSKSVIEWLINNEAFLFRRHLSKLLAQLVDPATKDFNFDRLSAKTHSAQSLIDLLNTQPVLAVGRVVVIEDVDQCAKPGMNLLCDYFKNPCPTTHVVLTSNKADKRTQLYKVFTQVGRVVEFKPLYPNQLSEFILSEARNRSLKLEQGCAQLLCEAVGNNLELLVGELTKLELFVHPQKYITRANVSDLVSSGVITNVFELGQWIALKKYTQAWRLTQRMQESGESLVRITALVIYHFRRLLLVKSAQEKKADVARAASVPPFFVKDYLKQANAFSPAQLKNIYARLLAVSVGLRSAGASGRCVFETFLQDVCTAS